MLEKTFDKDTGELLSVRLHPQIVGRCWNYITSWSDELLHQGITTLFLSSNNILIAMCSISASIFPSFIGQNLSTSLSGQSLSDQFPVKNASTTSENNGRFCGWCLEKMEFRKEVMSLLGDTLGVSTNLDGKDHRNMGKSLSYHYGDHFPTIFCFAPQFLEEHLELNPVAPWRSTIFSG